METREEKSRNNSAALGQSPGFPQGIHVTVSLSSSECFTGGVSSGEEPICQCRKHRDSAWIPGSRTQAWIP